MRRQIIPLRGMCVRYVAMSPLFPRSRAAPRAMETGHQPPEVTLGALFAARRSGLESSTAALPTPVRRAPAPVARVPPELEATRAAPPPGRDGGTDGTTGEARALVHHVLLPDGTSVDLSRPAVAGRAPSPCSDAEALVLVDPTRSVSRAHARLEPSPDGVVVVDLGSANGTVVRRPDGSLHDAGDGAACVAEPGSTILLGDVALTVTVPSPDPGPGPGPGPEA